MANGLILLSILFLSACSSFPQKIWFTDTQTLIQQHQYKKALEQIQAQQPLNRKLFNTTQAKAKQHRKNTLKKIETLFKLKQWGKVKHLLIIAELEQPEHSDWQKTKQRLAKLMSEELRVLRTVSALQSATLLKTEIKIAEHYQRSETGPIHWHKKESILAEKKLELAEELLELSTLAIKQQDYKFAQKTYAKAIELNFELKQNSLTEQINKGLSQSNRSAVHIKRRELLQSLKKATTNNDFPELIKLQSILSKPPFYGKAVKKALRRAQTLREQTAEKNSRQADTLYRQHKIDDAIELWKQAKYLNPNLTEIDKKLTRSLKVQSKLKALSAHNN